MEVYSKYKIDDEIYFLLRGNKPFKDTIVGVSTFTGKQNNIMGLSVISIPEGETLVKYYCAIVNEPVNEVDAFSSLEELRAALITNFDSGVEQLDTIEQKIKLANAEQVG